ncbi:sentrin-specific protease 6-like [Abeliophyllum distichum]|uniref:Sentrin-specific protease 6-like n=1 Tax=Abeliophyllum distichum TaxID=126358 RepID=A0ABD1UN84_9LAMI
MADVQPFACIIPHLLARIDVWQLSVVNGVEQIDPLPINLVHNIPQQDNGTNCGVFVIKYAEHILNGNVQEMPNPLEATIERTHLAAMLFKYGMDKCNEGYDTNPDFVSRRERKARKVAKKKNAK